MIVDDKSLTSENGSPNNEMLEITSTSEAYERLLSNDKMDVDCDLQLGDFTSKRMART